MLAYGTAELGSLSYFGLLILAFCLVRYSVDMPDTSALWQSERTAQMTFLTADGRPIETPGRAPGKPVRLTDLPAHVPDAILALEDRNFRHHLGVNPLSVLRALYVNAAEGKVRQGGSTITQQLAKNLFLSSERTLKRKLQELLLAFWLEHRFSKDEILTLYLNRVYFGGGAYGVDAASRRYFAKPASEISIAEAAVLAGLLKAPSKYTPTREPRAAGLRARLAIDAMEETGFIARDEAAVARRETVVLAGEATAEAPYFVDFANGAARALLAGAPVEAVVQTTLDVRAQEALTDALAESLPNAKLDPEAEIAVVVLNGDGAILALQGGRNYRVSEFNRATRAKRQPGSAFKPFVYLAAMERGAHPQQMILDAPLTIGRWSPDNYKSKFYGEVTLTYAFALSLNSAAVRLQEWVGRPAVAMASRRAGLEPRTAGPALALGVDAVTPLTLAGAYAPFANGGASVAPYGVRSVRTVLDNKVIRPQISYVGVVASPRSIRHVNYLMRAVSVWGTGKAAGLPNYTVYGKTGTTQDSRDAWFAGHAGGVVCVVWTGRDDNAPMKNVTGGGAPAKIWSAVMARVLPALGRRPDKTNQRAPTDDRAQAPIFAPLQPAQLAQ
ncbi:MAG: PBP1A family penicillin-binding protein [Pseudomonadota bacterium]